MAIENSLGSIIFSTWNIEFGLGLRTVFNKIERNWMLFMFLTRIFFSSEPSTPVLENDANASINKSF